MEISQRTLPQILEILDHKLEHNICDVPPDTIEGYSPAAVLILLVKDHDHWSILYTQRTNSVRDHKGQVSFPGGAWEECDPCLKDTALRETTEEIGINVNGIKVFGSLPGYKTITNYYITPFIGTMSWPVKLQLETEEVESVFLIPITWLMDKKNREDREFVDKAMNIHRNVPFFKEFDGHLLWGITAMLTIRLIDLLK